VNASEKYQKVADAIGEAIRTALGLISEGQDPLTHELAKEKRALERRLRSSGYSKTEAKAEVHRIFAIDRLGDNDR
jgi:hypothetical protein